MSNLKRKDRYALCLGLSVMLGLPACVAAPQMKAAPAPAAVSQGMQAPFSEELKKWLEANNIRVVVMLKEDSQAVAFDTNGSELQPCGNVVDSKVPPECGLDNISVTATNNINVVGYTPPAPAAASMPVKGAVKDPCMWVNIGGVLTRQCW